MLITSIILYLVVTVLIGIWAARRVKTSNDFMLAGRSLPIVLSTSALFATWFGSETIFGASSEFLNGGLYAVIEDPFGAALCLVLFGMFFARKLYAMNLLTLCDYFRHRFDRKTEFVASVFMVPSYFGYIAAQLVALGLILNVVMGIPVWQGIVASSIVVTLYTFVGGMWAISVTDFIQSIIIVVGLGVLAYILSSKAGGVVYVIQSAPAQTFKFLPDFDRVSVISYFAAWSVLGLGSIPSQDVFQRAMSSGSSRIAVQSCYYAAGLYLTIAMLPLFISLCAKHLYPESLAGDTQLTLPNMVLQHAAMPVQILFFGSLLSAIMSTTSSAMLAPAAVVTENILKPMMKDKPTDLHFLMITRLMLLLVSIIATILACLKSNIYELVGGASILSLVSLFIPMALGMYWKRSSATGAILSMTSGIGAWLYFELYPWDIPGLVPAVVVSLLTMVIGSLFWPTKKF
ncbi:MAG: sodium:solute symporter family protein [Cyclobacteriaceae bacterium]|nr:sodium:solute symporter family protein [Cyclobacteriaceae bacterium]